MRFTVAFDELVSVLGYSNTILSDKSVEEKLKNIIFLVTKDDVRVVAYNAFTFARTEMNATDIDCGSDKEWAFQIKASELNKIISSFSSLYKTKVSTVDFEEDGVRIKITVHEEAKDDADARLTQDSEYKLENAPIIAKISDEIHMEFPQELDLIPAGDLLLYLDSLFGILNNDTANSIASKINFAEDYVFVIASSMSAFMVNKLPDAFKDLSLAYSSVNFLKKVTEKSESVGVARLDKYLCVKEGLTETFMKYQKVKVKYDMYVNKRSKDKGIVVDRLYLKDVLKRMGSIEPTGTMRVLSSEEIQVSNSNFQQSIPLNNFKDCSDVAFNMSVPILEKIILGRDDVFSGDLFIYFVKTTRGYIIFFSDSTGAWFTNTQVTAI